jgi:hypothetical protein
MAGQFPALFAATLQMLPGGRQILPGWLRFNTGQVEVLSY